MEKIKKICSSVSSEWKKARTEEIVVIGMALLVEGMLLTVGFGYAGSRSAELFGFGVAMVGATIELSAVPKAILFGVGDKSITK